MKKVITFLFMFCVVAFSQNNYRNLEDVNIYINESSKQYKLNRLYNAITTFNNRYVINVFENNIDNIGINIVDNQGYRPLIIATLSDNLKIVKYLLDKGADINIKDPALGYDLINFSIYVGSGDITQLLLEKNKSLINKKDINNWTPLMMAVIRGNVDMVKYLIDNGANLNDKDIKGNTPLDLAVSYAKGEIVKILKDKIMEGRS